MQIYPNQIDRTLSGGLKSFYLIFGDEPQQRFEILDKVRKIAQQQGFSERQSWVTDNQFEWDNLIEASQSLSLFSSQKLIELEIPTGKPGSTGSKALIQAAEQANPDTLFLIHGPKIGRDVQNSKWFKTLDKQGIYVPCFPLEGNQLRKWIREKCEIANLNIDQQQIEFLADYSEGNMLAAHQEIEKLTLLYGQSPFSIEQLRQSLANHSRYNVFQLVDALLLGDSNKAMKILLRLESEGIEPNAILWALNKESQVLNQLSFIQRSGKSLQDSFRQFNIWQSKQALYYSALQRLSGEALAKLEDTMTTCDSLLKSHHANRPYITLSHLCLLFIPHDLSALPIEYE